MARLRSTRDLARGSDRVSATVRASVRPTLRFVASGLRFLTLASRRHRSSPEGTQAGWLVVRSGTLVDTSGSKGSVIFLPCRSSTVRRSRHISTPRPLKHLVKRREDVIRRIAKDDEVDEHARVLYYVDHAIASMNDGQSQSGERVSYTDT
jgi:hypothetical protein